MARNFAGNCKDHSLYRPENGKPAIHNKGDRGCETCWALFLGVSETCENCGCQSPEEDELDDIQDGMGSDNG